MFPSKLINALIIHKHIETHDREHIETQTVSLVLTLVYQLMKYCFVFIFIMERFKILVQTADSPHSRDVSH